MVINLEEEIARAAALHGGQEFVTAIPQSKVPTERDTRAWTGRQFHSDRGDDSLAASLPTCRLRRRTDRNA